MEVQKTVKKLEKRKKVLWEYVLEPENKATYWDHVAFSTSGRGARGRTTVSVEEHQGSKKTLDVIKEIDAPTNL